jgi:hypothetical protein
MPSKNAEHQILASPTKRFFVDMLTRDIDLKDAVLDLLDNCVDGLMRSMGRDFDAKDGAKPYEGFRAEMHFARDGFQIRDNCGGISLKLAEESAFRLGRPKNVDRTEKDIPTVGTYGIGMKRAIFKMGRECEIISRTKKEGFSVKIPRAWFFDEDDWYLSMTTLTKLPTGIGTSICVKKLLPDVAIRFGNRAAFPAEFEQAVSQQYSLIIAKGFEVRIDGRLVKPLPLQLRTVNLESYKGGIAPFMYSGTVDGVHVDLYVGFYQHVPAESELDEIADKEEYSADEAGWTVICNDRVVIYRDKTRLTGWGEAGVPSFHNQFNAIAGVVHFRSNNAALLPVNTTKRGIDPGSDVYLRVKDRMREGLKKFTSYTNKLKKLPQKRNEVFSDAVAVNISDLRLPKGSAFVRQDRKLSGKIFDPDLPAVATTELRTIRFSRPVTQIELIAKRLLDNPEAAPGEVGEYCFDRTLRSAEKK